MLSFLYKNIAPYLFICLFVAGITGCKPKVSPKGQTFLDKVSSDISALSVNIEHTIHARNISNAVEVICD